MTATVQWEVTLRQSLTATVNPEPHLTITISFDTVVA
jgi:hypothetical protein